MDVKSGTLFWPRRTRSRATWPALRRNLRCDVVVVGAGLTGAMIAQALSREGLRVVILEKRNVGRGSTCASTALVLYEIDTHLVDLARQRGWAAAAASYQRCLTAIDELERLTRQLGDACGFRRRHSLYVASRPQDFAGLKREFAARKKAGFDLTLFGQRDVEKRFSFSAPGALYSVDAAEVDPFRLTHWLIRDARQGGARLFIRTEAAQVTETSTGTTVRTSGGYTVHARWTVMAAGFETALPNARRFVHLKSTYAVVTRPSRTFAGWPGRCLIWETNRPYLYLWSTSDDRVLIGGEDEDFVDARKRDRLIGTKARALRDKFRQRFPEIPAQLSGCWAGTFGETKDGLPYIGPLRPRSRILYALCYGANGTNFAVIAADVIRDSILGRRNRHAGLFAFNR